MLKRQAFLTEPDTMTPRVHRLELGLALGLLFILYMGRAAFLSFTGAMLAILPSLWNCDNCIKAHVLYVSCLVHYMRF